MVGGFSNGTRAFGSSPLGRTTTLLDQGDKRKDDQRPALRRTDNAVDESEKGDDKVKDTRQAGDGPVSADAARRAAAERQRLAQQLVEAVRRLSKCKLKSQRATHLALLKRELALAQAALAHFPSERNYAAIVILAEGVIAATCWADLSDYGLGLLRDALASGLALGPVCPDEYLRQVRTLHASGVRAGPTFELNVEDAAPGDDLDAEEPADEPGEA